MNVVLINRKKWPTYPMITWNSLILSDIPIDRTSPQDDAGAASDIHCIPWGSFSLWKSLWEKVTFPCFKLSPFWHIGSSQTCASNVTGACLHGPMKEARAWKGVWIQQTWLLLTPPFPILLCLSFHPIPGPSVLPHHSPPTYTVASVQPEAHETGHETFPDAGLTVSIWLCIHMRTQYIGWEHFFLGLVSTKGQ